MLTREEFRLKLEQNGYKRIGFGAFSAVFAKDNKDFVVKVGMGDDRWQDYIEWAIIKGYAGKFAPKVYNFKHYGGFYVAVMERLVATQHQLWSDSIPSQRFIAPLVNTLKVGLYDYHGGDYLPEATDLIDFGRDVSRSRMCSDMHEGNVMLRKDGQLVLIDPLSGSRIRDPLRIKWGRISKSQTIIVINLTMEK